jgi:hypothetical protein
MSQRKEFKINFNMILNENYSQKSFHSMRDLYYVKTKSSNLLSFQFM